MSFAWVLDRMAGRRPNARALSQGPIALSYRELTDRVARLGEGLVACGLVPGDRVAILQSNRPAVLETMLACWHRGLVCVPLNARCTPYEAAQILADASPGAIVFDGNYIEHLGHTDASLRAICVDAHVDGAERYEDVIARHAATPPRSVATTDPAWLFFSSGTTGRMKGATLSHRSLMTMALCFLSDIEPLREDDVVLHAAPLTHGSGLYALPALLRGAHQRITLDRSFDPSAVLDAIARDHVTSIAFLAPTMVNRLVAEQVARPRDTSGLRWCVYGGAPMYVEDIKTALATFGPVFAQIYGQAECPMTITRLPLDDHARFLRSGDDQRLGSTGQPFSGMDVRIDGPAGQAGEILVRGDAMMSGYWANQAATETTIDTGWLRTGDIGTVDAAGYFYLSDRAKDVIISGGTNIYPREIEEVILQHAAVREVCVVGAPDAEWGERVVAVLSVHGTVNDTAALKHEIVELCRERLSGYKVPRQIDVTEELPKGAYGKILKRELRDAFWAGRQQRI